MEMLTTEYTRKYQYFLKCGVNLCDVINDAALGGLHGSGCGIRFVGANDKHRHGIARGFCSEILFRSGYLLIQSGG